MQELEGYYKPQKTLYQQQIDQAPAYYNSQAQGLDVAKQNAFSDILGGASSRGLAYSGVPISEQSRYVGEKYLPALASLKKQQAGEVAGWQDSLSKVLQSQASQAYGIRQHQMDLEEQQRQFEIQQAAAERARRASAASLASPSFGRGLADILGGAGGVEAQGGPDYRSVLSQSNPYVVYDFLRDANKSFFGGKANYGQLANWAEQQLGAKIGSGSAADLALRSLYLNTPLNGKGQSVGQAPKPSAARNVGNYVVKNFVNPNLRLR